MICVLDSVNKSRLVVLGIIIDKVYLTSISVIYLPNLFKVVVVIVRVVYFLAVKGGFPKEVADAVVFTWDGIELLCAIWKICDKTIIHGKGDSYISYL